MAAETIKSPLQIKYEIGKTRNELSALLRNWKQKKSASLAKLLSFRSELKELDAVLAETEKGYRAYCRLLNPLSDLVHADPDRLTGALTELEKLHPALASCVTHMLQEAAGLTNDNGGTETGRVLRAREAHKTASEHIQRKTREVYAAMKEEKENVEAYAVRLTNIIEEKNKQFQLQSKTYGIGL
jgi:hypothetical protein